MYTAFNKSRIASLPSSLLTVVAVNKTEKDDKEKPIETKSNQSDIQPTTTSTHEPEEGNTSYSQPFTSEKALTFYFLDELQYYLQGYNVIQECLTSKYFDVEQNNFGIP